MNLPRNSNLASFIVDALCRSMKGAVRDGDHALEVNGARVRLIERRSKVSGEWVVEAVLSGQDRRIPVRSNEEGLLRVMEALQR